MNKRIFRLFLLILLFSCKSPSLISDYGIDKKDQFFSIAVLPDTQYYTAMRYGGTMKMFQNQINWIIKNKDKEKIAYVIHLGDVTDKNTQEEWERAKTELYKLEAHNIPYGVAVGNHDQTPNGNPAKGDDQTYYNKYFGKDHFIGKHWYGGSLGNNNSNDDHFDIFESNGLKFLVMYFAYNQPGTTHYSESYERIVMRWADSVLSANRDRKVILVSHSTMGRGKNETSATTPGQGSNDNPGQFTKQGKVIYDMAKHHNNVFLMLGGHIAGESFRKETYNGNVIKAYLADYQSRQNPPYSGTKDRNGGNGTMRLMRFNITKHTLSVITFVPKDDGSVVMEVDGDSQFTEPLFN